MGKKLAHFFSVIFHPIILPALGIMILFNSGSVLEFIPFQAKKIILVIVFVCTAILPLTFIPFYIFQRIVRNVQMEQNRERLIPLLVTTLLYFLCYCLLVRLNVPETISLFVLAATHVVLITFMITFKWKISIHLAGIGGFVGALIAVAFRLQVNLEYFIIVSVLLSGILGYSRLKLNKHKPYQIYTCWGVGFAVAFATFYLF